MAMSERMLPNRMAAQWSRRSNSCGRREVQCGNHAQRFEIEVGLVKTVEDHDGIRARLVEAADHVGDRAEVRPDLDRERDAQLRTNLAHDVAVALLDDRAGQLGIARDVVEIQFEGRRLRPAP